MLDSFALLAYLGEEPGASAVEEILVASRAGLAQSWLSVVNLGEVLYITERAAGFRAAQRTIAAIDQLPVRVVEADRSRTFTAAHVKASFPVSYAAAFAVALAHELDGEIVTGDPEFEKVEDVVRVCWIGESAR